MRKRIPLIILGILALAGSVYLLPQLSSPRMESTPTVTEMSPTSAPIPTATSMHQPEVLPLKENTLKRNILSAGDYLVRQQLANGELAYQVNFLTDDRSSTPSYIRLMGGTSVLYTVCRVAKDSSYCEAGDRALEHYLSNLLSDAEHFKGTCLYTNGACPLGGASITIDVIYKRWQATGSVLLGEHDLLATAVDLGYFIASMRRPDGGFYHSFDPHYAGTIDPNYADPTFNGEGMAALLQLYEMTGNAFWLEQAREVNDFLVTQTVTEDYGHSYGLALLARLDKLNTLDQTYAQQIADLIIAGQIRSLNPINSSGATATKLEALASIAQALALSDADPERLDREIQIFTTFVQARQLPENDCNFDITAEIKERYMGGLFASCDDPSIRVDGLQHWVNGLTLFLEYQGMKK